MSDTVIRVENLGKKYVIGHQKQERYTALRDVLADKARSVGQLFSRNGQREDPTHEEFWALKDVSFEIKQGDRVGIIGRNGAGKSTLLKILSRITEPTEGRISIKGRVASLLEVGTGFHPELTGRENVYLNGAILGMTKVEIKKKFDEIVAFAEVEKFLDTPVKRYSSGMYVRLAFAVAAHLEPEILIVDEVLAVGDAQFQKKCLGKMEDVAEKEGRTVLFVSHNMGAILSLTNKSIFLQQGFVSLVGLSEDCIAKYLSSSYGAGRFWKTKIKKDTPMQIMECRVLSESGSTDEDLDIRKKFIVEVVYEVRKPIGSAVVALNLHTSDGSHLMSLEDADMNKELLLCRQPGTYRTKVEIPGLWLNSGRYLIRVGCGIPRVENYDNIEALSFDLLETADIATRGHRAGYLLPMLAWQTVHYSLI
ncbi:ABC transporter ATP-binding protein [Synechocystis sp. PCC 7339]|uniref:ABC transporter ATP-binding protein n=1 Tax=Synechocystis sp. PCC 7339 TaxID=2782213 RepID=UPI001CC18A0A|nr:ABC transporter ATP-binding protein [Synechocystis sp. PCC 7339]